MTAHRISRRTMLRGAGAALALPMLEAMTPRARAAAAAPPLRMAIFTVTGGTVIESWKPKAEGKLETLPSILRPLDFAKDDLLILSGLSHSGKSEGGLNAHEHAGLLHLTGCDVVKKVAGKPVAGISVDQAVAQAIGDQTYLPSIEMGLSNSETKYSFRTPDSPVPYETSPRLVFDRMFRGRAPMAPQWSRKAAATATAVRSTARSGDSPEKSVLDLVQEEAKALQKQLGSADQQRLEEYLHAVRAMEKRIALNESQAPELVAQSAKQQGLTLPKNLPDTDKTRHLLRAVQQDPEHHGEYIRMMADLFVLALQTDSTRVITFACGSDGAMFPGVVTVGYERHAHTLEHQGNSARVEDADPIAREGCRQIHAWYTTLFAEMVKRMKAIDEGGTSLLDNSMLLYTSYMADGGHGRSDYPVLLAGRAKGTLKTGRHVAYKRNTPMSNLYVEMLNRMGVKTDTFGDNKTSRNAGYDGRLPGLG